MAVDHGGPHFIKFFGSSAAQIETLCRGVEQVSNQSPDGQSRWVKLRPCKDGMVRLEARLHPDEAALVLRAIDVAPSPTLPRKRDPSPRRRGPPDPMACCGSPTGGTQGFGPKVAVVASATSWSCACASRSCTRAEFPRNRRPVRSAQNPCVASPAIRASRG